MSLQIRAAESDHSGTRWHWSVYDDQSGHFVRNGEIAGNREKAERAAQAAIMLLGGTLRDIDG